MMRFAIADATNVYTRLHQHPQQRSPAHVIKAYLRVVTQSPSSDGATEGEGKGVLEAVIG